MLHNSRLVSSGRVTTNHANGANGQPGDFHTEGTEAQRGRPRRLGRRKWRGDIYSDRSGVFPLRIARVQERGKVSVNVNKDYGPRRGGEARIQGSEGKQGDQGRAGGRHIGWAKRGREETDPLRIINYRPDPFTDPFINYRTTFMGTGVRAGSVRPNAFGRHRRFGGGVGGAWVAGRERRRRARLKMSR